MKIALFIILFIGILFLFKYLMGGLETSLKKSKKGKNRSRLNGVSESLEYVDIFDENREALLCYEIQTFEDAKKDLISGKYDFGLFDKNSVPKDMYELSIVKRYQIGPAAEYLEDPNISYPNLVLVTYKKNMHKLKDLGIINSSRT